jgi:hypothetical protein
MKQEADRLIRFSAVLKEEIFAADCAGFTGSAGNGV